MMTMADTERGEVSIETVGPKGEFDIAYVFTSFAKALASVGPQWPTTHRASNLHGCSQWKYVTR